MFYLFTPLLLALWSLTSSAVVHHDQGFSADRTLKEYATGQVLVKIDINHKERAEKFFKKELKTDSYHNFALVEGLALYKFNPSLDVLDVINTLSAEDFIIYAEPDYINYYAKDDQNMVNDPDFAKLWGLENQGQNSGKIDADINANRMWAIQSGSKDIVVGIIDTGVDYNHPDLNANMWRNPGEIPGNNIDDDKNGYIDDVYGINAIKNSGNPFDDNMHGTHVAGTIGAQSNNGIGVVGVAQSVQIAGCKFLSAYGSGTTSDALKCMDYFAALKSRATNPVNLVVTNNSWGGGGSSQALLDAIRVHERLGIIFVAAAGNDSNNNDAAPTYPANYDASNIISVAATDNQDRLASFSNYGKKTVHVAAPGVKIYSTLPGNRYGELSGTSMAAPHVSGLVAVIASQYRNLTSTGIRNLAISSGQKKDATITTTISGRRIRGADDGGVGALTCKDQIVTIRKEFTSQSQKIALGQPVFLSALSINCEKSSSALTLYSNEGTEVVLYDDGQNGDLEANDGILSFTWTPSMAGDYQLKFSDNDIVTLTVYDQNVEP